MAPFRILLTLVPLLACSSLKGSTSSPVEAHASPSSIDVAAAVRKACPTARDAAALEHALLELGPTLTHMVPAEAHTSLNPERRSYELVVEVVDTPVVLDGFPVEWQPLASTQQVCLSVEQLVSPEDSDASIPEAKVRSCDASALSSSTDFYLSVQLHLDCAGGRRAFVFQSPTPRESVLSVDNPSVVAGPFDVWLGAVTEGERLKLAGGCFPFWSERLLQRAGLEPGTERIGKSCTPFMARSSDGSFMPWFFIKPRRSTAAPR